MIFASLLVISACGHLKNQIVGLDKSVVNSKPNYDQLVKEWGEPEVCHKYFEMTYCNWKYEMVTFKGKDFVAHKTLHGERTYQIQIQSMSLDENTKKRVYLMPGSKDLNKDGIEWRESIKYIQAVLSSQGFMVVSSMKDSEQIVAVNFGISEKLSRTTFTLHHWPGMNDSKTELLNRRFLALTAIETRPYMIQKKQVEVWKVHASSVGMSSDIPKVVPFLARAAEDYLAQKSDGIMTGDLAEDSLYIHALYEAVKETQWPESEDQTEFTPAKT